MKRFVPLLLLLLLPFFLSVASDKGQRSFLIQKREGMSVCLSICLSIYLSIHLPKHTHTHTQTDRQIDRQLDIHVLGTVQAHTTKLSARYSKYWLLAGSSSASFLAIFQQLARALRRQYTCKEFRNRMDLIPVKYDVVQSYSMLTLHHLSSVCLSVRVYGCVYTRIYKWWYIIPLIPAGSSSQFLSAIWTRTYVLMLSEQDGTKWPNRPSIVDYFKIRGSSSKQNTREIIHFVQQSKRHSSWTNFPVAHTYYELKLL